MDTSQIKDILYRAISQISESKIQKELTSGSKSKIVTEILLRCTPDVAKIEGDMHENFGIFAESLTHYLLTNALIPSQRKIKKGDVEIDIVIPDLRTLDSAPKNSLVLYFAKTNNTKSIVESLTKLQSIQPHKENILVISKTKTEIPFKTYDVDSMSGFATMLDDIGKFLSSKPQSKFKIFRT
jgi:hypothetical protein